MDRTLITWDKFRFFSDYAFILVTCLDSMTHSTTQVYIPLTSEHKGKGMAYVKFKHAPHALEAFKKLDGTVFQGRLLHILPAVERETRSEAEQKQGLKDKKLEAKKQTAVKRNNVWDWGSLYMNVGIYLLVV
jgi:RNA recognition motif-containing protein